MYKEQKEVLVGALWIGLIIFAIMNWQITLLLVCIYLLIKVFK